MPNKIISARRFHQSTIKVHAISSVENTLVRLWEKKFRAVTMIVNQIGHIKNIGNFCWKLQWFYKREGHFFISNDVRWELKYYFLGRVLLALMRCFGFERIAF